MVQPNKTKIREKKDRSMLWRALAAENCCCFVCLSDGDRDGDGDGHRDGVEEEGGDEGQTDVQQAHFHFDCPSKSPTSSTSTGFHATHQYFQPVPSPFSGLHLICLRCLCNTSVRRTEADADAESEAGNGAGAGASTKAGDVDVAELAIQFCNSK
ncbi:uncharacterized protein LOC132797016 isoform X2 [Drosophila nasuta]|uniref:uncharacterized protein LOC132797016 isoform X2 n=1 Tax=Drosophila nasuta TaxID=42062 RepID=UPI00295F2FB0|nr:uncharacterized protein LOC132797016 isoform X2 [Drosophila nasuta]